MPQFTDSAQLCPGLGRVAAPAEHLSLQSHEKATPRGDWFSAGAVVVPEVFEFFIIGLRSELHANERESLSQSHARVRLVALFFVAGISVRSWRVRAWAGVVFGCSVSQRTLVAIRRRTATGGRFCQTEGRLDWLRR
jgi:hypothetical protein